MQNLQDIHDDPIGGEPLEGSGFESEQPESDFLTSELGGEE